MDTSIIGIIAGFLLIGVAVISGGSLAAFMDLSALFIVLGGTLSATIVAYPLAQLKNLGRVLQALNRKPTLDTDEIMGLLVSYAEKARREGLLSLEDDALQLPDPFLQKGIQLVVDGTDQELVRSILETELSFLEDRHRANSGMFESMGAYAPAFGMIGTLIGLVQMLRNLEDPASIGSGMAVALVTTLYGTLLSNLIFLPIGSKLRNKSRQEVLMKEVMIEGVLSIQAGENPRIVEEKLKAFLAPQRQATAKGMRGQGAAVPVHSDD